MELYQRARPYLLVIFLQFGCAGLTVIAKFGLNHGMSHYTFSVYRNAVAAIAFAPFALGLERKERPRMTISIFLRIMLLGLLEPVLDQNLYFMGLNYTPSTFAVAMTNMLPAMTFVMAWIFRLEKVNMKRLHSQVKVVGTLITIGGAMIMTLLKGGILGLPWTKAQSYAQSTTASSANQQDLIKGSFMITAGCLNWAAFYILQAFTLKLYPAALSLTSLICMMGSVEGAILTLIVEKGNTAIWSLGWDAKLLAAVYGGIICSGVSYYIASIVMKEKGPFIVTAFNPLSMVIVALASSFILSEQIYVGTVTGAAFVVSGLYLVVWGKSKDEQTSPSKSDGDQVAPVDQEAYVNGDPEAETPTHDSVRCTHVTANDQAV
ncbi:hypothetical protein NMG60_11018538 [Bertholletia excelsa]